MPRLDFYVDFSRFVGFRLGAISVVIGRAGDCDIQLAAATVSRHHTRVLPTADGGYAIEDLSSNGTRVNAQMIQERTPLRAGDRIYIENYVLIFQPDETPPESLEEERTTLHGEKPAGPKPSPP